MSLNIAAYIDHTVLKPSTTAADVEKLCAEAAAHHFAAVCVPPYYVRTAKKLLEGTAVQTATVIGFPFGYSSIQAKHAEITQAIADGADELDLVHNIAALKNGDWLVLKEEIKTCTEMIHRAGKKIKVIIESGILNDEEIIKCCEVYAPYNIDFMKTSTGYAEAGASVHAVQLMRSHLPAHIAIKASGGIRTFAFAQELAEAGATRIGASASVKIAEEAQAGA
jgi:deoxyribose-phosphate aldolase